MAEPLRYDQKISKSSPKIAMDCQELSLIELQ